MRGRADGFGGHSRCGRAVERKRQLGEVEKCCGPWACFCKHVLNRLQRVVLVHHTVFVMVVRGAFQMHFSMHRLELPIVVERSRLAGRCEGLAEEGEQQDDCEQSAHEVDNGLLGADRNHSYTGMLTCKIHVKRTGFASDRSTARSRLNSCSPGITPPRRSVT